MTWTILRGSIVQLPDGRRFDIETKEGTNEFLKGISDNDFFSSKLSTISKTRAKKKQLITVDDKERMKQFHDAIRSIGINADPKLFRELIPHSDIRCWLDFVSNEIKLMSKKKSWIRTGDLDDLDESVLASIAGMCNMHALPVALAFEAKFFSALADLVKVRKGKGHALPSQRIASIITDIAFVAMQSSISSFDWSLSSSHVNLAVLHSRQLLKAKTEALSRNHISFKG